MPGDTLAQCLFAGMGTFSGLQWSRAGSRWGIFQGLLQLAFCQLPTEKDGLTGRYIIRP